MTATDIVYGLSASLLAAKGASDIQIVREGMGSAKGEYVWGEFGDLDGLIETRMSALSDFITDYSEQRDIGRYIEATLPHLPFADGQFDLVLSGNFLFTYAEQFDHEFHRQTLFELLRVSSCEVRIYPLVSVGGHVHPYMSDLISELEQRGYVTTIKLVPYQFQLGTNEMLQIRKRKGSASE